MSDKSNAFPSWLWDVPSKELVKTVEARDITDSLDAYWRAPSEGDLNGTWQDKPHRLLYDLLAYSLFLRAEIASLIARAEDLQKLADANLAWGSREAARAEKAEADIEGWRKTFDACNADLVRIQTGRDALARALQQIADRHSAGSVDGGIARDGLAVLKSPVGRQLDQENG